jgi:predicted GIY-YIG superfamily endonuclease
MRRPQLQPLERSLVQRAGELPRQLKLPPLKLTPLFQTQPSSPSNNAWPSCTLQPLLSSERLLKQHRRRCLGRLRPVSRLDRRTRGMNSIYFLYISSTTSLRVYVGATNQPWDRFLQHKRKTSAKLAAHLSSMGLDSTALRMVIITTCTDADRHKQETHWYRAAKAMGLHPYNHPVVVGTPEKNICFISCCGRASCLVPTADALWHGIVFVGVCTHECNVNQSAEASGAWYADTVTTSLHFCACGIACMLFGYSKANIVSCDHHHITLLIPFSIFSQSCNRIHLAILHFAIV